MLHLALHIIVPAIIALLFFRTRWLPVFLIMVATMLVDLDHLLASPVYDPGRCSIGFHPLHGLIPIAGYALMCISQTLRYVGIGMLLHMALDSIDCQFTNGVWYV